MQWLEGDSWLAMEDGLPHIKRSSLPKAHQVPQRLLQVDGALQQGATVPPNHPPNLRQLRLLRLFALQLQSVCAGPALACNQQSGECVPFLTHSLCF